MEKGRYGLYLVMGEIPDNEGHTDGMIKAGVKEVVVKKRSPVGTAQKPHTGKPLEYGQLNVLVKKIRPVTA